MRSTLVPGHAKVGPPGTSVDLIYGPLDQGWDLDAFDSTPVLIHDAPRPNEIVLWIGYATGAGVNARCKGPDQQEVGPPGTSVDLIYGPLDQGWDLDAFDSTPVLIHDAPRSQ